MFSTQVTVSPFVHIFDIISLFVVELEEHRIGISGKGLKCYETFMNNEKKLQWVKINREMDNDKHNTYNKKTINL